MEGWVCLSTMSVDNLLVHCVQMMSAELSVSGLAVAPVKHQITSAFRRPPGLTSPSPGGLPVSPHTSSTDPNNGHSPTVGAHPPSHSPGSHPSAVQGNVAMTPVAGSSGGKPVGSALAAAVPPPPVTGYAVADYSRKINNLFDIVEVPADEVVRQCNNLSLLTVK